MSHDDIPSLAEAMAEIRRLRGELQEATQLVLKMTKERIVRDVQEAFANGTLEKPQDDEPLVFVRHVPPNAPPHDE